MKLTNKTDYSTSDARLRLVTFISATIQGHKTDGFEPYKPNEHDDMYWTVDSGNNWKVKFHADQPHVFEIIYRYNTGNPDYEKALAAWLKVRISAEVFSG